MATPPTTVENAAAHPATKTRTVMLGLLGVVVLAGTAALAAWYFLKARWYEHTDDAYINGNVVQITPQVAGTVVSIGADDGDLVKQGAVLVELDRADSDVALKRAGANLAATVRKVRGLYSTVDGAQADVAVREVRVQKAKADLERRRGLASTGAISAEELSHAEDEIAAAMSALITGQQQLRTNRVLIDATVVTSHPEVQAAAAQYAAAYLDNVRSVLLAPVTGYVAKRTVQVGQRVAPGAPLMAVVPLREVWVDANFKETQLTHMRIGQPVTITSE